ncbi:endonuclease/exonuclease/phosphatase family protein [Streptomyces sp. NPDC018833]|uniref:endonuclease/exonuclease/phosphatase family protein n=1 Tax=Streptomyces sp. NPDC018833 TaxID=3365053 RepID=UPI00379D585F
MDQETQETQEPGDGSNPAAGPYDAGPGPAVGRRRGGAWFAGLLLIVPTVVVACRAADTDAVTPVPQLLAFLPWLLVPAGVALLAALAGRHRVLIAWAVAVLAMTGWFVRPYDVGLTEKPPGPAVARVDVLTANLEFGAATDALLATLARERPGLVFVQECTAACSDALAAGVSRADYPYRHVVEAGGAAGSAILSRYPLAPAAGVRSVLAMPAATADIAGRSVDLQLAHPLPPVPEALADWRRELGLLRDRAAATGDGPAVVAGDFNATQDHAAFRGILRAGGLRDSTRLAGASRTPSWPAGLPRPLGAQIDHVLVSEDFSVRSARFLDLGGTDHRALLVALELHDVR